MGNLNAIMLNKSFFIIAMVLIFSLTMVPFAFAEELDTSDFGDTRLFFAKIDGASVSSLEELAAIE